MRSDYIWDVYVGKIDPAGFFALVPQILPEADLFFAEGCTIEPSAQRLYSKYANPGPYVPDCATLAPALFDHMSLFNGERFVSEWLDAFANAFTLDGDITRDRVEAIASAFDCDFERMYAPKNNDLIEQVDSGRSWWKFW